MTAGNKALICFGKCCVTINCSKSLGRRLKEEASQGKRNVSYQLDSFKKAHFFFCSLLYSDFYIVPLSQILFFCI